MNELEKYVRQLEWELRDLPKDESTEVVAEVQTHIEAGEEEDGETAVSHTQLIQDLGSPTELARNLRRANWKRNTINASLALIPLFLLNLLNSQILIRWGMEPQTFALTFAINIFLSLAMVFWAYRRNSKLLCGWWLSNSVAATLSAYFLTVTWPFGWPSGPLWQLTPLGLLLIVAGFYGRFLWKNHFNGLLITFSLIPFLWGGVFLMAGSAVSSGLDSNLEWRLMWTMQLGIFAKTLIVLIGFLVANRFLQWGLLALTCVAFPFTLFALWLPNPNAIFWLLLITPFLLGFGVELASYSAFRKERIPVQ